MLRVSTTTALLAERATRGQLGQEGPPPPTEAQAAGAARRAKHLEWIFQFGCSQCCVLKLQQPRILHQGEGELACPLLCYGYQDQLTEPERLVAASCAVPILYEAVWRHAPEVAQLTPFDVVELRPFRWGETDVDDARREWIARGGDLPVLPDLDPAAPRPPTINAWATARAEARRQAARDGDLARLAQLQAGEAVSGGEAATESADLAFSPLAADIPLDMPPDEPPDEPPDILEPEDSDA